MCDCIFHYIICSYIVTLIWNSDCSGTEHSDIRRMFHRFFLHLQVWKCVILLLTSGQETTSEHKF